MILECPEDEDWETGGYFVFCEQYHAAMAERGYAGTPIDEAIDDVIPHDLLNWLFEHREPVLADPPSYRFPDVNYDDLMRWLGDYYAW